MNNIANLLFETKALKICPENKPFWYTSGKIGPYFINTHFIYGSEKSAADLLSFIDEVKVDILSCPKKILEKTLENYEKDPIYKEVIDTMLEYIKSNLDINAIDYISGGERRDWFFSLIIANKLQKPHITIFKDLNCIYTDFDGNNAKMLDSLNGAKVLHIADLITIASSYERAWIPAIEQHNGKIEWSLAVVDRLQGGKEILASKGVTSYAMINIDKDLFDHALEQKLVSKDQYDLVLEFIKDPDGSMKEFIKFHPEFIENALASDEKTAGRAKLCLEKGFYA